MSHPYSAGLRALADLLDSMEADDVRVSMMTPTIDCTSSNFKRVMSALGGVYDVDKGMQSDWRRLARGSIADMPVSIYGEASKILPTKIVMQPVTVFDTGPAP